MPRTFNTRTGLYPADSGVQICPAMINLEHTDFLKKVPLVLGQDHAGKFSETVYRANPSGGSPIPSPGYRFPKREACLMTMSYSYELQAKVSKQELPDEIGEPLKVAPSAASLILWTELPPKAFKDGLPEIIREPLKFSPKAKQACMEVA